VREKGYREQGGGTLSKERKGRLGKSGTLPTDFFLPGGRAIRKENRGEGEPREWG